MSHTSNAPMSNPRPATRPGGGGDVVELRPVVAVVLDLFPDEPEYEVRAWRPTMYRWSLCGMPFPISDDADRQWRLMRPDTLVAPNA